MTDNRIEVLSELVRELLKNIVMLEKSSAACCDMTLSQCNALLAIGRNNKIALNELACIMNVDKSTMSRTTDNLVDACIAQRDLDPDNRRCVVIQLTDKGGEIYKSIDGCMEKYYEDILGSIREDKKDQVLESMRLLTEAVKNNKCCQGGK
jgi:DNA-binding MarR family transcriptional regulator